MTYIPSSSDASMSAAPPFQGEYLRIFWECVGHGYSCNDARDYAQMEIERMVKDRDERYNGGISIADFSEPILIVPSRLDDTIEDIVHNEIVKPGDTIIDIDEVAPLPVNPIGAPNKIAPEHNAAPDIQTPNHSNVQSVKRKIADNHIPQRDSVPSFIRIPRKPKQRKRLQKKWDEMKNSLADRWPGSISQL